MIKEQLSIEEKIGEKSRKEKDREIGHRGKCNKERVIHEKVTPVHNKPKCEDNQENSDVPWLLPGIASTDSALIDT